MAITTISLRIDERLKAAVAGLAEARFWSVNDIINRMIEDSIKGGREKVVADLEREKQELAVWQSIFAKAAENPSGTLSCSDFKKGSAAHKCLSEWETDADGKHYPVEALTFDEVRDFMETAAFHVSRLTKCLEAIDSPRPAHGSELVDDDGYLTKETIARINECAEAGKFTNDYLAAQFGYKQGALGGWFDVLRRQKPASARARSRIASFLLCEENAPTPRKKKDAPKLRVVEGSGE